MKLGNVLYSAIAATSLFCNVLAVRAQTRDLGVALGVTGGATKYYGEFTNDLFGPIGDVQLTFNPIRHLTVGVGVGLGSVSWKVSPQLFQAYPQYFGGNAQLGGVYPGTLTTIEQENQTRVSLYDITIAANLLPDETIVPYVGAGFGLLSFSPTNQEQHSNLPNNVAGIYDKLTWSFPTFIGAHVYVSDNVSINAKGIYRFTLTEYLDDFSSSGGGNDNIASVQLGVAYHFLGNLDPDYDNLTNAQERALGTKPRVADTDGDGLFDGYEVLQSKTDPLRVDTDGDGLSDGAEVNEHLTNPILADSDADGLNDGIEVITYRTLPNNVDTDGDRLFDGEEVLRHKTNPLRADTDYDGLEDADELSCRFQTNPLTPDTDHDGLIDSKDPEPSVKCEGCGGSAGGGAPFPYANPEPPAPKPEVKPEPTPAPAPEPKPEPPAPTPPPTPAKKKKSFAKDIRFKLNNDEFDFDQPETQKNLQELLSYMQESCDDLQVMLEGHASGEGPAQRNKELSDLRARRVRQWLMEQGVPANKIRGAVGYGSAVPRVKEPTANQQRTMSKLELEAIRAQNRRIEVAILKDCPAM